jgi:hypothetical protein
MASNYEPNVLKRIVTSKKFYLGIVIGAVIMFALTRGGI